MHPNFNGIQPRKVINCITLYFKFNSDLCFRVRNDIIDCIAEYYCATWFTKDEEEKTLNLYFLSRKGLSNLDLTEKLSFKIRIQKIFAE